MEAASPLSPFIITSGGVDVTGGLDVVGGLTVGGASTAWLAVWVLVQGKIGKTE